MRHLFQNEATQRVEFFRLTQQLKEKEQEVSRAQETVTACTRQAEAISRRRQMLDQATAARDQHVARTVSQALDDLAQLQKDRDAASAAAEQAKQDVDEVFERLEALDPATVAGLGSPHRRRAVRRRARSPASRGPRWPVAPGHRDGRTRSSAGRRCRGGLVWPRRRRCRSRMHPARRQRLRKRARGPHLAGQRQEEAAAHLTAVRLGQAGPAGERLKQADIGWHLLDDAVEVAEDARPLFDPLLVPFSGAICVHPDDHADAVAALAGLPGCMLVSGDGALPDGVIAAPPGASGLLAWLATYGRLGRQCGRDPRHGDRGRRLLRAPHRPPSPRGRRPCRLDSRRLRRGNSADARRGTPMPRIRSWLRNWARPKPRNDGKTLAARRDMLRSEAAAVAEQFAPLDDEFERADAAHRDARAEQRTLDRRTG